MADEIKTGDNVVLKSGGPEMTVEDVGTTSTSDKASAWCVWFQGAEVKRAVFPIATLIKSA